MVGESMNEIKKSNKQIGDPYDNEVLIFYIFPGIPGDDEDGKSNNNTEHFCQGVKKKVVYEY